MVWNQLKSWRKILSGGTGDNHSKQVQHSETACSTFGKKSKMMKKLKKVKIDLKKNLDLGIIVPARNLHQLETRETTGNQNDWCEDINNNISEAVPSLSVFVQERSIIIDTTS